MFFVWVLAVRKERAKDMRWAIAAFLIRTAGIGEAFLTSTHSVPRSTETFAVSAQVC